MRGSGAVSSRASVSESRDLHLKGVGSRRAESRNGGTNRMMRIERIQEQLQLPRQQHFLGVRRVEALMARPRIKQAVLRGLSVPSASSRPRYAAARQLP